MDSTGTTAAPPKPGKAPETDKAKTAKVTLEYTRAAVDAKTNPPTRYLIGRRTIGNASGLSAFVLADKYTPDLGKLPESGTVTLTLDDSARVVGIGISASL